MSIIHITCTLGNFTTNSRRHNKSEIHNTLEQNTLESDYWKEKTFDVGGGGVPETILKLLTIVLENISLYFIYKN